MSAIKLRIMGGDKLTSNGKQAKGCVDTKKRGKIASLNITIEFSLVHRRLHARPFQAI